MSSIVKAIKINELSHFKKPSVITLGTFDGVHIAHSHIIKQVIYRAKQLQSQSVVVSYWPHPREILKPGTKVDLLQSLTERNKALLDLGIERVLHIQFDTLLANISAEDFFNQLLVDKLKAKAIVIGHDHTFGKDKRGDIHFLKQRSEQYGIQVYKIEKVWFEQATVSSSTIRENIKAGQLELANRLLGRPYTLSGIVIQGKQLGRTISFPTANIEVDEPRKLIPSHGVYVGWVTVDNILYKAMINIGIRPTVSGTYPTIEAHILDFNQNIYNKYIILHFLKKIRDEIKFESLESLKQQLERDKSKALELE